LKYFDAYSHCESTFDVAPLPSEFSETKVTITFAISETDKSRLDYDVRYYLSGVSNLVLSSNLKNYTVTSNGGISIYNGQFPKGESIISYNLKPNSSAPSYYTKLTFATFTQVSNPIQISVSYSSPAPYVSKGMSGWLVALIVISSIIAVGMLLYFFLMYLRIKNNREARANSSIVSGNVSHNYIAQE